MKVELEELKESKEVVGLVGEGVEGRYRGFQRVLVHAWKKY